MVWGAQVLADEDRVLYFWTITCRGKECSLEEAETNYYAWTNVLLTTCRAKCNRAGDYWCYVQVTERQKKTRKHPHSHLITTFDPNAIPVGKRSASSGAVDADWFRTANIRAGLGSQCRVSLVQSAEAVSRYVAKYMFKESMAENWPKGWKRIRYSRLWPKPPYCPAELAITLLTPADWKRARDEQTTWICENGRIFETALQRMTNIVLREGDLTF